MRKVKISQIISTSLTALLIIFIFSNSAQPASDSSQASEGVYAWLCSVFELFDSKIWFSHSTFRKLAHFAEYTALGLMLLITTKSFTAQIKGHIFKPLFVGLLTPVLDETIQLFCDGRSGEIRDVLIDFSGVLTGMAFAILIILIISKARHQD